MLNPPTTLEEAKEMRYGNWAGSPKGRSYSPGHCAYEVYSAGAMIPRQCLRKNGHGPEGLYCKQHAKQVEVE